MENEVVIPLFIAGTVLFVVFTFFIIYFMLVSNQKRNKLVLEKQKLILEAQTLRFEEHERTMTQISKEVHDNMGQQLNFLMMNLQVVNDLATDNEQKRLLETSQSILNELIAEAHSISHSLNTDFIRKRGLYDVLHNQLHYPSSKGMKFDIDMTGNAGHLSADQELLVYRIAQEAIRNAIKHSEASHVKIHLYYATDGFTMEIVDDGRGFDIKQDAEGIGLANMKERAKMLNGRLEFESTPGKGTRLTLTV